MKTRQPKLPSLKEEKELWKEGYKIVVGVDEVGRGSWSGPVVAAACAFPLQVRSFEVEKFGIDDSKALRSRKRTELADKIRECSKGWAVGMVGVKAINCVGIGKATEMAMRRAISQVRDEFLNQKTFVLIDAFHIKYLKGIGLRNQKAIKKGDQKSISIAAASILAKVYRDNLMKKLARKHPCYGWGVNKGYGTKKHQEAILKYGINRLHRKKFVETFLRGR